MNDSPGTETVREPHRFDEAALKDYLDRNLAGFAGSIAVRQFQEGQSNPTYHVTAGDQEYVLRKQPPGKLLPSAHAIDREYRIMKALANSEVPVPAVRHYCDDPHVIGTPFYIMDYVSGRVFTDPRLPTVEPDERRTIYDSMNKVLAKLHNFDWKQAGLSDYGRQESYFSRQISTWTKQYLATRMESFAPMERLMKWLPENIPNDNSVSIAHGDFRIGNLIYHPVQPRVVAVLDWELSTLGHPLSDLAFNCMAWHLPGGHAVAPGLIGADLPSENIPTEEECIKNYCHYTGRKSIEHWHFYMAFSLFRTAAIMQGVYARSLRGNASSSNAHLFGDTVSLVAHRAWELIDENS